MVATASNQIPKLTVEPRTAKGGRASARLRASGMMPIVIYGHKENPVHVSANAKEVTHLLHERARLLEVAVEGKTQACLVKDVQWDHLGSQIIHLDLARVDLNERVKVNVEVLLTGEAKGLKEAGAYLAHPVTEIEIECVVAQIPESLSIDISHLGLRESVSARDVKLPAGAKLITDPETIIAMVDEAVEEAVAAATPEEGAAAEPELIGRKPAEGEEAAAGDAAKAEKAPKAEKK